MKTLITGANGQVGWELRSMFAGTGEVIAIDREELDLRDEPAVRKFVRDVEPNLIINAAAYTAVDQAEAEPQLAHQINAVAPQILAEEAKQLRAVFITYSTDYVFDGTQSEPYTEDSTPNPLSVYGHSKLAGDLAVQASGGAYLILRTSWVYGTRGTNFLLTMLRLAEQRNELRVVDDQIGAPTWCRDIANATFQIVQQGMKPSEKALFDFISERSGIYNTTSSGKTSWFGFAKAIFQGSGLDDKVLVVPISSIEYPTPAARPRSSVLSGQKLERVFGLKLPHWQLSLTNVLGGLELKLHQQSKLTHSSNVK